MKLRYAVLALSAVSMASSDSVAQPGAASAKVVIPELEDPRSTPAFDAEPFPDDKSKPPKPDEWKTAPEVRVTRVARRIEGQCRVYRVREWLRVHCDRSAAGVRLIAGSASEIVLWVDQGREGAPGNAAEAIFPVRRGDRRIFELFDFGFGDWGGFSTEAGVLIEEQWLEGVEKPSVSLLVQ